MPDTLSEAAQRTDALVHVRNMVPGPTVFQDAATKESYEWLANGDQFGGDLQYVPSSLLNNPNFRRNLERGIFKIEEATPEIMAAYREQHEHWRRQQDAEAVASLERIENIPANDILGGIECVGPSPSGPGACRRTVLMREKELESRPPLCDIHGHLRNEFVPSPHPTEIDERTGHPKTQWLRTAYTAEALPSQTL